jgi:hypothetical protein
MCLAATIPVVALLLLKPEYKFNSPSLPEYPVVSSRGKHSLIAHYPAAAT